VVLLAFELRKKQFVFTHVTERFGEGLVDVMSAPIEKKSLDGLIHDYRSRTRSPMVLVDISPVYAIYLIEEAARHSGKQLEEIKGLKRLATDLTGDIRTPSDIYRLHVPDSVFDVSWQQVLTGPVFEPFNLTWKEIEEDRKEFHAIVNPQIVLPPHVVEEKKMTYLRALAVSEKMKPLRIQVSRMLEDYAYLFYRQGEYANCTALLKVVQADETADLVLQFLLKKSLEQKEDDKKQHEQASGLIINPYARRP
jgi:hypothetical protein